MSHKTDDEGGRGENRHLQRERAKMGDGPGEDGQSRSELLTLLYFWVWSGLQRGGIGDKNSWLTGGKKEGGEEGQTNKRKQSSPREEKEEEEIREEGKGGGGWQEWKCDGVNVSMLYSTVFPVGKMETKRQHRKHLHCSYFTYVLYSRTITKTFLTLFTLYSKKVYVP